MHELAIYLGHSWASLLLREVVCMFCLQERSIKVSPTENVEPSEQVAILLRVFPVSFHRYIFHENHLQEFMSRVV